ncbi:MAG: 30S ribosomal protein S20 [bacterium]|nr:30S ribosomal protein S20 [bacterium]
MANHKSAAKRHRQSLKRADRNNHIRATVRGAVRKLRQAAADDSPDRAELFQQAERLLRRATTKGVFHPRTTSRTVSRLSKLV